MTNPESIELGFDTLSINGDPTKLYEALAKAQAEFLPVPKGDEGMVGFDRKFKYAGYATLMRCTRPALSANGIAIMQPLHSRNGQAVSTIILAGHGASIVASFHFKAEYQKATKAGTVDDPQEFGRNHTYYRRYQLQGLLGLEGDDDADALPKHDQAQFTEKAPKSEPKSETKSEPKAAPLPSAPPEPVDPAAVNKRIASAAKQLKWGLPQIVEFYKKHIDAAGFEKSEDLSPESKARLLKLMVEVNGLKSV